MMKTWTPEEIKSNLETSQAWLERGIVAIFEKQTPREQAGHSTNEINHVGFSKFDADFMTSLAKWIRSGKRLTDKQVEKGRKKMLKYSGQLAKIANGQI